MLIAASAAGLIQESRKTGDCIQRSCLTLDTTQRALKTSSQSHELRGSTRGLVQPIEAILAPIFFVLTGIQVSLKSFFDVQVMTLALGLLVAAMTGKLAGGFFAERSVNRLAIGMMPREEVG